MHNQPVCYFAERQNYHKYDNPIIIIIIRDVLNSRKLKTQPRSNYPVTLSNDFHSRQTRTDE